MTSDPILICDCEEKCEHCSSQTASQIDAILPNPTEPIYHHITEFCYDFDSEGILRHIHTGETFSVKMTPMGPLLKRQEIIRAICTRLVRQKLFSLNMESSQIPIPGHPSKCMRVLHSANFFTHKGPLIILLQGGGVAQAGVWSPRLLLHPEHGLRSGSQISLVEKAHALGYAIAIINANEHVPSEAEMDAMESFSSSCQPVIDITKCINHNVVNVQCKSAVHEKSSSCISNLSACLTLSDTPITLLPTTIFENSDQLSAHFDHANSVFMSHNESSSNWQESQPQDRRLFQPNSTPSSPLSPPSPSSALSWLLTGPNSLTNHLNAQNPYVLTTMPNSNVTESTSITTTTATTSDLSSRLAKCVCTNTSSSPSSSTSTSSSVRSLSLKANHNTVNNNELQSQMNTFPVVSAQNTAKNAIPVSHNVPVDIDSYDTTAVLNSPNCQLRIDDGCSTTTCVHPVINTTAVPILQADGNLPFPTSFCAPASYSSSSIDASATPIINSDQNDTTANNHSESSEYDMLDVSVEDRLYGMWRHIIPHCASNKICVWAHQLGADAFIHPFKPMPGLFDDELFPSSSSSSCVSYDETSSSVVNNHHTDNTCTSGQVPSTSLSSSCTHNNNIPMNSDASRDLHNVNNIKLESTVNNSRTLRSKVSLAQNTSPMRVKRRRLSNELLESNSRFSSNTPADDAKLISNYSSNIVRRRMTRSSSSGSSSSSSSSRSRHSTGGSTTGNESRRRSKRKRHLSAGPVLTNLHRNEQSTSKASNVPVERGLGGVNNNTSSTLARNKSQSMKTSQFKSETPAGSNADAKENDSEDSTGGVWRDRRIYGPWRHRVTPETARRSFFLPRRLPRRPPPPFVFTTTINNNNSSSSSYPSSSVEVKKPLRNKFSHVQLPELSGSISDAKHFAKNGGVISQDVEIWSTSAIDDYNDDSKELFRIRLARAWQRKAQRLFYEFRFRVRAVVFTDPSCSLDVSKEDIGWGLNLLDKETADDEVPMICRPSAFEEKLPGDVIKFRQWLSAVQLILI
uniref:Arb2 domain-containing protein n=1 Tax=Trichobilharzia regenti TaxID=157069 RepID=A0AA85JSA2_TRIRE|nr:unnamed protein product [Trichobilharzia regenti]